MKDERPEGPLLKCEVPGCNWESLSSGYFEKHEIVPGVWRWVCMFDVEALELNEGK